MWWFFSIIESQWKVFQETRNNFLKKFPFSFLNGEQLFDFSQRQMRTITKFSPNTNANNNYILS